MQDTYINHNYIENFRIIPRFEIKENYLIKGMKMEGLKKIDDIHGKIKKYLNDGADELIIDDIVSSLYSRKYNLEFLKELADEINIPIIYSGGVRNTKDIDILLNNGADKVSINTHSFLDENIILESSKIFGSQCISCHIQTKKIHNQYKCFYLSGRENSNINLNDRISKLIDLGAGEIVIYSIDNDGMQFGIEKDIFNNLDKKFPIPMLYGGGVYNLSDIKYIKDQQFSGVILSSSLHYGDLSINSIKDKLRETS